MPELNRRGFLGMFAASVAVGAAVAPKPVRMVWSGWRLPANQDATVGWWSAAIPTDELGRNRLVMTTLGSLQRTADFYYLDLGRRDGWPLLSSLSTEEEKAVIMDRARVELEKALNA